MKKHLLLVFMSFAFLACSKSESTPRSTATFDSEKQLFLNQDLGIVENSESALEYRVKLGFN